MSTPPRRTVHPPPTPPDHRPAHESIGRLFCLKLIEDWWALALLGFAASMGIAGTGFVAMGHDPGCCFELAKSGFLTAIGRVSVGGARNARGRN